MYNTNRPGSGAYESYLVVQRESRFSIILARLIFQALKIKKTPTHSFYVMWIDEMFLVCLVPAFESCQVSKTAKLYKISVKLAQQQIEIKFRSS